MHSPRSTRQDFYALGGSRIKIKESVYTLIKNQIDGFKLPGFNVMSAEINHRNGSEFAFYGIERNTDEIKSFEGADILWIEEGS